jgi:hypothetical protein
VATSCSCLQEWEQWISVDLFDVCAIVNVVVWYSLPVMCTRPTQRMSYATAARHSSGCKHSAARVSARQKRSSDRFDAKHYALEFEVEVPFLPQINWTATHKL